MEKLSIAWISPFSPSTDIAKYSLNVVSAIQRLGHRVTLFDVWNKEACLGAGSVYSLEIFNRVPEELFDVVVVNVGNNTAHHEYINEIPLGRRCIVVLHDFSYNHYLVELYNSKANKIGFIRDVFRRVGPSIFDFLLSGRISPVDLVPTVPFWDTSIATARPMINFFALHENQFIVHSEIMRRFLGSRTTADVLSLRLPPFRDYLISSADLDAFLQRIDTASRLTLGVLGGISPSKQMETLVKCFANNEGVREMYDVVVCGRSYDGKYLRSIESMVAALGLDCFRFEPDVSDERLMTIKKTCDLFYNVRHPVFEGSSGSLLESSCYGRTSIISDSGYYKEYPDDSFVKISPHDTDSLCGHLVAFYNDRKLLSEYSLKALSYYSEMSLDDYAAEMTKFLKKHREGSFLGVSRRSVNGEVVDFDVVYFVLNTFLVHYSGKELNREIVRRMVARCQCADIRCGILQFLTLVETIYVKEVRVQPGAVPRIRIVDNVSFWMLVFSSCNYLATYACYYHVLLRDPDDDGLANYLSCKSSVQEIVLSFLESDEFCNSLQASHSHRHFNELRAIAAGIV